MVGAFVDAVGDAGARVLDVHSDGAHNRSVLTTTGETAALIDGMVALAIACKGIDLSQHSGIHPRLGALDVCPFVPHDQPLQGALEAARRAGRSIADGAGLPVYLYGEAATREACRDLRALRRGGLSTLARRAAADLPPDFGPRSIDPRHGVVCVGARGTLIAFNVWLRGPGLSARTIAERIRESSGGLQGIRALGLTVDETTAQVSINVVEPETTSLQDVFDAVKAHALTLGVSVTATEIVGLSPARYLPDPESETARLLMLPGRSLESALND
jgi:glutamate formiminotransferase